ncbi:MAG: toll/interleukin-1 receptor domain-containing protein, partial [Leptolyngbyaceae cyanobacterium]
MTRFQHIFISYGPLDSADFAQQLGDRLRQAGLSVSGSPDAANPETLGLEPFGLEPPGLETPGLETSGLTIFGLETRVIRADHILFVISPDAVNSPICNEVLAIALRHQKRIIPLMHVETITYDQWKSRHPNGTDADWQTYQDKGLHSSLIHLHPAIRMQEWIHLSSEGDVFDDSYQHLLDMITQQEEYARQHTIFLEQALVWERGEQQPDDLLTGEQLQAAADWLDTRYDDIPYPCHPTTLQQEWIAASLERVEPAMSQVFLCYVPEDGAWGQTVRHSLQQEGITVWRSPRIGQSPSQSLPQDSGAIAHQGIERADNVVYLLSSRSQVSSQSQEADLCQEELAYAQSHHKRVIVLRQRGTDVSGLTDTLQIMPRIDWPQGDGQGEAIAQLIAILQDKAEYYAYHKLFLVKALNWNRHQRSEDELLQGKDFVDAEAWLQTGKQIQTDAPPTRLHERFIAASQEKNRFFDGFISYGRPDSLEFATRLHEALGEAGFNVWFDRMDIPFGVDFQAQIDDGIERSHNFIFLISPHSTQSAYCRKEIELALRLNKRIIPLMHVEQITTETWQQRHPGAPLVAWETYKAAGKHSSYNHIHPEIGKINWIFVREGVDSFDQSFVGLTHLMHQHEPYVQQHTDLLIESLTWKRHQYAHEFLLLGEHRHKAEQWLQQEFKDEQSPCQPTDLQCELIAESRKYASNFCTQVFLCGSAGNRAVSDIMVLDLKQMASADRPVNVESGGWGGGAPHPHPRSTPPTTPPPTPPPPPPP